jgi:hypothetical protein
MKKLLGGLLICAGLTSTDASANEVIDYAELINQEVSNVDLGKYLGNDMDTDKGMVGYDFYGFDKRVNVSADFHVDDQYRTHEDKIGVVDAITLQFDVEGYDANDFPVGLPFGLQPEMSWLKSHELLSKEKAVKNLIVVPGEGAVQVVFNLELDGKNVQFSANYKGEDGYLSMASFLIDGNARWY